jgi:hypothetical protein
MTSRSFVTTVDPVDPKGRRAAKRLAAQLDDDSEVGQVVRSLLDDVAGGERVVVLRSEHEVTPPRRPRCSG